MSRCLQGLDVCMTANRRAQQVVIGHEVIGLFDIGKERIKMDALKPVTVQIARVLTEGGKDVITKATTSANKLNLPGPTARKMVLDHLQWHQDKLVSGDPQSIYTPGDDLKKWAMQAFIEANAVEEGADWISGAWSRMWDEIARELAKLPAKFRDEAKKAVFNITGIPWWAWAAGGAVVVGFVGLTVFKIATGPVGAAAAGAYLGRHR